MDWLDNLWYLNTMEYYIDTENNPTQIYTQEKICHNLIVNKADYKTAYIEKTRFFSLLSFSHTHIPCLKSSLQV